MIIKVTNYKGTYEIEAQGASNAMAYMGGVAWKLTGPVKVNGKEIPLGTITFAGISTIDIDGTTDRIRYPYLGQQAHHRFTHEHQAV